MQLNNEKVGLGISIAFTLLRYKGIKTNNYKQIYVTKFNLI